MKSSIFVIIGAMLILMALSLTLYNINEDLTAENVSIEVVKQIKSNLPEISYAYEKDVLTPSLEDEIRNQYEEPTTDVDKNVSNENPLLYIDGNYYLGIITIPSLDLELPILNDLTNKNLKQAPCKYYGSFQTNDLIIAGHNYKSHFGKLQNLNSGDTIYITGLNGLVYKYEVIQSEVINGYDIPTMKSGSDYWDLTLFTCTLSGQSRVTIRAIRIL